MSIARHHAEWLSLLEISGPFLSMPVLLQALPQGLDAHDPDHARELRAAYEEWADNQAGLRPEPAIHTAWIRYVLQTTLEFPDEALAEGQAIPQGLKASVPEHGVTLRPDLVIVNPAEQKPRLLIQTYPATQDLEKTIAHSHWQASPGTAMMTLLRATGVRLGLVTNGEQWLLVDAPAGETTGFVTWYAALWLEEPLTLRAFRTLLGVERFFNVPDDQTLEALLAASAKDQQEVTDQLGYQVRRAVEILIQSIDRADQDRGRALLAGLGEPVLYEAALTVMMRLVFLLTAEERNLLPLDDPFYAENYAAATLRVQQSELADRYGEELLEYRYDAWSRLLATFRVVHGGLYHDRLTLPAYGGSLFDPDRFPFLEGRAAMAEAKEILPSALILQPLPISNRTVLHLLNALQLLQVKVPGGGPTEARRLSFRALDIEQIGHVYESLLDHTAIRADEPVLGLAGTRDKEPEISLPALEAFWFNPAQPEQGVKEKELLDFLQEHTGRSTSALKRALPPAASPPDPPRLAKLRAACGNNDALYTRVLPWANLVRDDDFGQPVVIPAGSVYVTAGTERRATGTHYTPKALTEPIVQHTLEPLVYTGPAQGRPREQWQLRPAADLLNLKVCDMAMGSGAFLVQTCRYLSERLVEAWGEIERQAVRSKQYGVREKPPTASNADRSHSLLLTPEGQPTTNDDEAIPPDPTDRLLLARRLVADRCLYGVDKNPLAVEMAKLSLWLITLDKNRAFTFLDHALKNGDSLVGVNLAQLLHWNLEAAGAQPLYADTIRTDLNRMISLRRQLAALPVNTITDQTHKAHLLAKAEAMAHDLKRGGDMLIGSYFNDLPAGEQQDLRDALLLAFNEGQDVPPNRARQADLGNLRPFHWPLEFPEVFLDEGRSGFDAFVGNPPFMSAQRITSALGQTYRSLIVENVAEGNRGTADLCAYFFLRNHELLNPQGSQGLIATNTISEGNTRDVGLSKIVQDRGILYRAVVNQKWSGAANLTVPIVWIRKNKWNGEYLLNGEVVKGITPFLNSPSLVRSKPYRLIQNSGHSFQGSIPLGMGFVLTPEEALSLIRDDQRNSEVVFPFLNGQDLNSQVDQTPTRWIINFHDWPLEKAKTYTDCFHIVETKVRPERQKNKEKQRREIWWRFTRPTIELYRAIEDQDRVLVCSEVTKYLTFALVSNGWVYSANVDVFTPCSTSHFLVLQSSFHEAWARTFCSHLETRLKYSTGNGYETYPFPDCDLTQPHILAESYHEHRRQIMLTRQEGLTATYNRFHNPEETAPDIAQLRDLHVQMDTAIAAAYGWADLDLAHDFHDTPQGLRFTISETARREVLGRLLELNHQRYEEEVLAGLHEKKSKGKKGKRKDKRKAKKKPDDGGQMSLF